MTLEQAILKKVRSLSPAKQQEVLDFAEFLTLKTLGTDQSSSETLSAIPSEDQLLSSRLAVYAPQTPLGQQLWALRQQAIAEGMPLLSADDIEAKVAEQRDRHRDLYENLP